MLVHNMMLDEIGQKEDVCGTFPKSYTFILKNLN